MKKFITFLIRPTLLGLFLSAVIIFIKPEIAGLSSKYFYESLIKTISIMPSNTPDTYSFAVKKAAPAVVNISTRTVVNRDKNNIRSSIQFRDDEEKLETSIGSGVIISADGFIITNNHVIEGLKNIVVTLRDNRDANAIVVGIDPETDLAVLKISLNNLPYIHLADSNKAEIGDIAMAIGNPFGLGQTVTIGIISATGRNNLQLNTYENFIQTDAAINIGNSGGALINSNGDLLGISTLLVSRGGGNEGIGFAIPSNMAHFVMDSIISHGVVIRGWLGIDSQPLSQHLADSHEISINAGVIIYGVYDDGPADKAGLRRGDILTSINGNPTSDGRRVMNQVAEKAPGTKVILEAIRNGKRIYLKSQVARRPNFISK